MTLEQRIEVAARASFKDLVGHEIPDGGFPAKARLSRMRVILSAAFPELFSDPPTAWIAPWEMDKEALSVGEDAVDQCVDQTSDSYGSYDIIDRMSAARHSFVSMRDNWLSRNPAFAREHFKDTGE